MRGCLHQIIRKDDRVRPQGWGDCRICQNDDWNRACPGYQPVAVTIRRLGKLALVKVDDET